MPCKSAFHVQTFKPRQAPGVDATGAQAGTDAEEKAVDPVITQRARVIERNPDSAVAYNDRGFACEERGDYELAITDYDKAIEQRLPDGPPTGRVDRMDFSNS